MKYDLVRRNIPWLLAGLLSVAASLPAQPQQIMALGAEIVTVNGHCPVYLRGVDVSGFEYSSEGYGAGPGAGAFPESEVLTSVEVAQAQWNCNFVRIPLNQDLWLGVDGTNGSQVVCEPSGPNAGDSGPAYQQMVEDVVNWCNDNNVYVLLDLHWSGLGDESSCSSGQHDMPDVYSVKFWESVAATFPASSYPGVLFDLYNEPGGAQDGPSALTPNDQGWSNWLNGLTESASADGVSYYTPGMQNLLNAIRSTGASNMVCAGGINWAFDLTGLAGPAGNDGTTQTYWLQDVTWGAGVAYLAHIYPWKFPNCSCNTPACFDYTTQGVLGVKPVMVTEFGPDQPPGYSCGTAFAADAPVDPEDFVPPMVQWLVSNKVPFTAWNMGSSGPDLVNTSTNGGLTAQWSYKAAEPAESTYPPTSYFGSYVLAALTSTSGGGCGTPTETFTITPTYTISQTPTPGLPPGASPEVFPNPFRPSTGQVLRFGGIAGGSSIHIYDMLGHPVRELTAVGNPLVDTWNGVNDNGRPVVTGIYLLYISQPSGSNELLRVAVLP